MLDKEFCDLDMNLHSGCLFSVLTEVCLLFTLCVMTRFWVVPLVYVGLLAFKARVTLLLMVLSDSTNGGRALHFSCFIVEELKDLSIGFPLNLQFYAAASFFIIKLVMLFVLLFWF